MRLPSNDPCARLNRAISLALDLGAGAAIAGAASGCGGLVVFEQEGEADGGGVGGMGSSSFSVTSSTASTSITSSTSNTSSTSSGPLTCDVVPPPDSELVYHCPSSLAGPPCPAADSPEVLDAMALDLDVRLDPPGFCCEPGCAGVGVTSVPCGPDPRTQTCCYFGMLTQLDYCMGRPLVIAGAPRTALDRVRGDWMRPVAPSVSRLDEATRTELGRAYREDALLEHASIASFARFTLDLLSLGAPADLVSRAERALGDEVRHAELCFGLASAYAGVPVGPSPLDLTGAGASIGGPKAVWAAVREGCVGETVAALLALAAADAAEDLVVRAALTTIAEDEASHAALAWRFAAWALAHPDPALREAARGALAEAQGELAAPRTDDEPTSCDPSALRAHGRLPADERRALGLRALAEVVRPTARALLGA